jgi:hypothetical protein
MADTTTTRTHEQFVAAVRAAAVAWATNHGTIDEAEAARLLAAKLVYGVGSGAYRGVCHYGAWAAEDGSVEVVEIAATGEESLVQVAGTTLHELGHVLAGWGAGHGAGWKKACGRLGLRRAVAAGQAYCLAAIAPEIRSEVVRLIGGLVDGRPAFLAAISPVRVATTAKPCPAGVGVRGGKSRGAGSGSRLRLWVCECTPPVKVRVASDAFAATCNICGQPFRLDVPKDAQDGAAAAA